LKQIDRLPRQVWLNKNGAKQGSRKSQDKPNSILDTITPLSWIQGLYF